MTRNLKPTIAGIVAGAVALAVALGAAGAVTASRGLSADDDSKAVIEDAAARLGVAPNELKEALQEAMKSRVDDAVEAGRLTEAQGEELKERIDSGETPFLGRFGHHGPGGFGHLGHLGRLESAASYLGLSEAEVRERLAEGKTLAEIAKAEDKSVDGLVQALVSDAREKLDAAVDDGRLTRAQADELADGLEARVTDLVNGELPERGFHHRFGGSDHPFGGRFGSGFEHRGSQA